MPLFLGQNRLSATTFPNLTRRLWDHVSPYVVSTNVAGTGTTNHVTSGDDRIP